MPKTSASHEDSPKEKDSEILEARIEELESELTDLQMLHEIVISHGTELENDLIELVETLSKVASDLEQGEFDPQALDKLVDRPDELGQLGRAFQVMGLEVHARERRLRDEVQELRIQIDLKKKKEDVNKIVESEIFTSLQEKAKAMRKERQDNNW